MSNTKINESHVLVLKECGKDLQVEKIAVEDASCIINEIDSAVNNPNKTLLDVQSLFLNRFHGIADCYPYLFPYSYESSYVHGACKPQTYTYQEYQEKLNEMLKGKIEGKSPDEINALFISANATLKHNYAFDCKRYIQQQMTYLAFQKADNDSSVKMCSREGIGWRNFVYNITDDIKVCVYTNFGFGYACYFTLTVSYKDIIIAPFSHIVKYYKANMTDIIRCTRDYYVDRDSWYPAFDFVKDFANQSKTNPVEFVEKYLMNEINEMMDGLRNIIANPTGVLYMFKRQNIDLQDYHHLRLISPMSGDEKKCFETFPHEMPVIFKAEKMTQALHLLDRLKELGAVYPKLNEYVEEIQDMVVRLTPEIQRTIDGIEVDIKRLNEQKEPIEKDGEELREQIEVFDKELDELIAALPEHSSWRDRNDTRQKYEEEHPAYVSLKQQRSELRSKISKLNEEIDSRKRLIYRLSSCLTECKPYAEQEAA